MSGNTNMNFVDLDAEDSDDDIFKEANKPIFKRKSPVNVIDAVKSGGFFPEHKHHQKNLKSSSGKSTDGMCLQIDHAVFGSFRSTVLGAQHFPVEVNVGDRVLLRRDPTHIFDPNTVQVYVGDGAKLGNLPRGHAAVLSSVMVEFFDRVGFQATVLNIHDRRQIKIVVDVFAKANIPITAEMLQQAASDLKPMLDQVSWWKSGNGPTTGQLIREAMVGRVDKALHDLTRDNDQREKQKEPQSIVYESERFVPADVDMSMMADWQSQQQELDKMFEEIQQNQLQNLPNIPMPKQFEKMDLYDFQKQGIRWLYNQETSHNIPSWFKKAGDKWICTVSGLMQDQEPRPNRGALLADAMGLGKTLQTLGLILLNPPEGQKGYPYKERSITSSHSSPRCTLIVCPVTVVSNWISQIKKHVNSGIDDKVLSVRTYHGADREKFIPLIQYNKIDVLITSYHTLAADFKRLDMKTNNPAWKLKKRKVAESNLSIFYVQFHRVVLDEAHIIRSGTQASFFRAAVKLQSTYRLGLTGTPFVNRPSDMHSLLSFLQVEPLANKRAFDQAITKRIKARDERGLGTLRNAMAFVALRRNKAQVQSTIQLLGKTIEERLVSFPKNDPHKEIHDILFLSARASFVGFLRQKYGEQDIFDNWMAFLSLIMRVRQACCHGGLVPEENRANAMEVYELMKKSDSSRRLDPELAQQFLDILTGIVNNTAESTECVVCLEVLEEESVMILKGCQHVFCETCLSRIESHLCPCCRAPFSPEDLISKTTAEVASKSDNHEEKPERGKVCKDDSRNVKSALKLGRSPKIQALVDAINDMACDEKAVIFSQWTSLLDIIEIELQREGHTYTRIDGSMNMIDRVEAMDIFDSERCDSMQTPRFILCSLMACGTGINLTRANVCFLMDPWWNAASENQAMDRVHRIGQKRPVRVIRFLMEDSMETRMMAIQESKSAMGKGSLENLLPDEKRKARFTTLRDLFQVTDIEELWE